MVFNIYWLCFLPGQSLKVNISVYFNLAVFSLISEKMNPCDTSAPVQEDEELRPVQLDTATLYRPMQHLSAFL